MPRRPMDEFMSEDATAAAQAALEQGMAPGVGDVGAIPGASATTDGVSDEDLAALAQGDQAPVGADMGEAMPMDQAGALANDPGALSPTDDPELQAALMEASKRRLLAQGGAGGAGGGGMAGM